MELSKAIGLVKSGEFINLPIYEVWEIKRMLTMAGTPEATEALGVFDAKLPPKKLKEISEGKADDIEAVWSTIDTIKEDHDPLKDDEFQSRYNNFWNNIEFEQDAKDPVNKEIYRHQIEELAELEAEKALIEQELAKPGSFLNASKEKQSEAYRTVIKAVLDTKCTELVATQTVADLLKQGKVPNESQKAEVAKIFNDLASGKIKMKIHASKALSALAAGFENVKNFAKNLEIFAGVKKGIKRVKKLDEKVTKSYPTAWPMVKGVIKAGAISAALGGTGIAAYGVWRLGKTIKAQRDTAIQKQMGYWDYLKSDKTQMFTLGGAVVTTTISCAGISPENFGLAGEAINGNLGERFASMFSNADSAADGAVTLADRGRAFWNAIANNFSNTTYLARTGAATATSVAIASAEFAKLGAMDPGSKEYLAQKKAAWRMLRGSAYGTLLGMTVSGAMGAMNVEHMSEPEAPDVDNSHLGPVGDGENSNPWRWDNWKNKLFGFRAEDQIDVLGSDAVTETTDVVNVEDPSVPEGPQIEGPQIGDEVFRKEYPGGVVETHILGENGAEYQQVSGLSGSIETSDSVQRFYEHRIHNMNEHNHLIKMIPGYEGTTMTASEAASAMVNQIKEGFVELPDGLTPEHAVHTAFMHAHYTGDMSLIEALSCPNGEDTVSMFNEVVPQYSTNNGFIGRPIDPDAKLLLKAGTIEVKTPCVPSDELATEEYTKAPDEPPMGENPQTVIVKNMPVAWAPEPEASVSYPSAYAHQDTYPNNVEHAEQGYKIHAIDRDGDGLQAVAVRGRHGEEAYRFIGDNRAQLEITGPDGSAYQESRHFDINNGYGIPTAETAQAAAEELGGNVGEVISAVDEKGNTVYHFVNQNGLHMTFNETTQTMNVDTIIEGGAPYEVQKAGVEEFTKALNAHQDANLHIQDVEKAPETGLTKISVPGKRNDSVLTTYARFNSVHR